MALRLLHRLASAAFLPLLMAAAPATAAMPAAAAMPGVSLRSPAGIDAFYAARSGEPLWLRGSASASRTESLIEALRQAELDGFVAGPMWAARVASAVARADGGEKQALDEADRLMSAAWVDYVQSLHRPIEGMIFGDSSVVPRVPAAGELLTAVASAPDLKTHLAQSVALNPIYGRLRDAMASLRAGSVEAADRSAAEQQLRLNMERARMLPVGRSGKYIVVDAAAQRLSMFDGNELRGSMRVIVGKPDEPTPLLASVIRTAVLNPYWNVPTDLVRKRIAPNVIKEGPSYLAAKRYELLADWSDRARRLDPSEVDWQAVAAGTTELRVRQLPGPDNAMGKIKFSFANPFGVYLHDTNDHSLFAKPERNFSSGCVRLEDADALAAWLFGTRPAAASAMPEQAVSLPRPVPVYLTYLTAAFDGARLSFVRDPYGRDSSGIRGHTPPTAIAQAEGPKLGARATQRSAASAR